MTNRKKKVFERREGGEIIRIGHRNKVKKENSTYIVILKREEDGKME